MISMILAVSQNGVIGDKNTLPWHIPEDLKYFKQKTLNNVVVMGKNTWLSLGKHAPLKDRLNVVVSSTVMPVDTITDNIEENIKAYEYFYDEVFIIGGKQLYEYCLPFADRVYLTLVKEHVQGDTVINIENLVKDFKLFSIDSHERVDFCVYERITTET